MIASHIRQRNGTTRWNVAVVVAIIVLLAGLLVTGVGRVREAAAEAKCKNNLKQIVLGLHCYNDVMNRLPPLVDQGEGAPTGQGLPSVFHTIWNYMEAYPRRYWPKQSPPENYHAPSTTRFTFEQKGHREGDPLGVQNGGDANQSFRILQCPGDATTSRLRDVPTTLPDGSTGYYATGSYAANGILPWAVGKLPVNLSNTIAFAERPQVCGTVHNLWGVGFYSPQMPAFAALAPQGFGSTGQVAPVTPLPAEEDAASLRVRMGMADAPPQEPDFASPIQRIRTGGPCDPRLPGSPHRGGMQAAMADGGVRMFAWDTTPWVWWAACVP